VSRRFIGLVVCAFFAGCVDSPSTSDYQFSCGEGSECPLGQLCQAGLCVAIADGGTDAGADGGTDAGHDAGIDDGGSDAGSGDAGGEDGGPSDGGDGGMAVTGDAGEPDAGDAGETDAGDAGSSDAGPADSGAVCDPGTLFVSARSVSVGSNPGGIAVGDFKGDGFLDYAVTDWGDGGTLSGRLNIFLGDGGEGFQRVIVPVGPAIEAVAVADIAHGGYPDILVVSAELDSFGVIEYGGADAGFAVIAAYEVGLDAGPAYQPIYAPVAVAVADLNRDGYDDVVLADTYTNQVSVLYGSAAGTLSAATLLSTPLGGYVYLNSVAVGDLDGDQIPDLVIASGSGELFVALGRQGGGFGAWSSAYQGGGGLGCDYPQCGAADVALADLNGDGFLDAIVPETTANEVDVFFNDQSGGLYVPPMRLSTVSTDGDAGIGPLGVAVADFNGDGILDIASAEGSPYPDYSNGCFPVSGFNQSLTLFAGNRDGGSNGYWAHQEWVRDAPNYAPRWLVAAPFRSGGPPDLLVSYLNELFLCDSSGTNCEGGLCGWEGAQANLYPNTCY